MKPQSQESAQAAARDRANERPDQSAPAQAAPRSHRTLVLAAVAVVALAASAYIVWRAFIAKPGLPDSILTLSGRIEGDDSAISPKSAGRILEIRFREGDAVKAGDVIATLSDEQVRARGTGRGGGFDHGVEEQIGSGSDCCSGTADATESASNCTVESGRGGAREAGGGRTGSR